MTPQARFVMKSVLLASMILISSIAGAKEANRGTDCPLRHKGGLFGKTTPPVPPFAKIKYGAAGPVNTAK